jgi:hypothetical protein
MEAIRIAAGFSKPHGPNVRPDQRKTDHFQNNAPPGRRRCDYSFLPGRLFSCFHKSQGPRNPAQEKFREGDGLKHVFDTGL